MRIGSVLKGLLTAAVAAVFVLIAFPSEAAAEERISAFLVDIDVQEDTSVRVVEQITYDLGQSGDKRGIFREIPLLYGEGKNQVTLDFELESVTDENGNGLTFEETGYANRSIRIGDADVYLKGEQTYVITYTVDQVITGFDDYDEFFWNVTGTDWSVPIDKVVARVVLPEGAQEDTNVATCFTGVLRATEQDCTAAALDDRTFLYQATNLSAYEGLSLVAGFDVGVVDETRVRKEESITQFLVEADLKSDGSVDVQEWVLYQSGPSGSVVFDRTLGNASGIGEEELLLDVDVHRVTDVDGNNLAFTDKPTAQGHTIRVTGDTAYQRQWFGIEYTVHHAFETTELADVFVWDLLGEAYDIPVREVFSTVSFADEFAGSEDVRVSTCVPTYFGVARTTSGSEDRCATVVTEVDTVTMFLENLEPYEDVRTTVSLEPGMVDPVGSVVVQIPDVFVEETIWLNGEVTPVTAPQTLRLAPGEHTIRVEADRYVSQEVVIEVESYQQQSLLVELELLPLWKFLSVWLPLLLSLLGVVFVIWLWARFGKDPRGRGTTIAQYDPPPGLKPAEVGVVYDRKAHTHDLTATIVWLAVHGYLKIVRTGKGKWTFEFKRTSKKTGVGSGLTTFEQRVYDGIFGETDRKKTVKLSALKGKFYAHLPAIKEAMYDSVVEGGYFPNHPDKTPRRFVAGGLVLAISICVASFAAAAFFEGVLYFLLVPVAALVFLMSFFMAKRTKLGVETLEQIKGFKLFLKTAEKGRLEFHQGPEKFEELFEEYLPYAVALEVEEEWAKQFKDIYKGSPDWYVGDEAITAISISHALSSIQSVSRAAFVAPPTGSTSGSSSWSGSSGFSGGGFSGGGFGGGGGGSW